MLTLFLINAAGKITLASWQAQSLLLPKQPS